MASPSPRTYSHLDEPSLVEMARSDAAAFAELYRRHVTRIYAYAYRRSGSQSVAEDVTSNTFEKALRSLDSFRWKQPGIAPWLFRIASNELVNLYRGEQRQTKTASKMATAIATPAPDSGHDYDQLRHALTRIKPRYQRTLTLRYFADLTNEEAAAAMGVSKATLAVLMHRSVAALRNALEAAPQLSEVDHG